MTVVHSGVEIGQGINTKVAQVAAMCLGVPVELVTVQDCSTREAPNSGPTGGSVTSGAPSHFFLHSILPHVIGITFFLILFYCILEALYCSILVFFFFE